MAESKHTPGPWRCRETYACSFCIEIGEKDIAWLGGKSYVPHDENKANARLIAAAPELLEALEKAEEALNAIPLHKIGNVDSYKVAALVGAVIRKAKGES